MSVLVCDKNGLLPVTALQCVNLSNGGEGGGKTVILAGLYWSSIVINNN